VNIRLLNALIFSLGGALAGLAGLMSSPILSVQPGMGEPILILVMIVIVIGGIGSVHGAFFAALMVGVIDTAGRAFLPLILREFIDRSSAQAAGPAIASMLTCVFMAAVLALRPQGLFPVKNG
jgi:branched-chain amino acid transport system permease protein